ncbi:MAG: hypothetical protein L6Q99_01670 [Planctomycetes bacterium]|nr:hypothetical protein [Planctomycetota bacterium]
MKPAGPNLAGGGWVRALAPAKVNPYLAVLGKRADGYHEVDTTLVALDWCDTLAVRASDAPGVRLDLAGPFASADVPRDGRNLVVRAAELALAAARGIGRAPRGLDLVLEKHVPSQAGLGGGSSDAAAAWLAVTAICGIDDDTRGREALATLGSDCVFFFAARATGYARCRGRGELVEPLIAPRRERWLVVATPAQGAPTAAVYAAFARNLSPVETVPMVPLDALELGLDAARSALFARLEPAALSAVPALADWRRVLDEVDCEHFRLSGSGSSFFGLFDSRDAAEAAQRTVAEACARRGLAWRALRVATFARHGARLLAGA